MQSYSECNAPIGKACFGVFEGIVTDVKSQRWSSTSVQTVGGGGYVHPTYGGYIAAPQTISRTHHHERTDFWVRDNSGQEKLFTISANVLPTSIGHRVRFVYGGSTKKPEEASLLFGHNLTSGHYAWFEKDDLWNWARMRTLIRYPFLYRFFMRWIPLFLVCFALFVVVPLSETIGKEHDPHNALEFFNLIPQALTQWTPSLVYTEYMAHMSFEFCFGLALLFIGLGLVWGVMEYIGFLLYGRWWRMVALRPLQKELSKITGFKAPTGLTNMEWLISVVITCGVLYFASRYLPFSP